MYRSTYLPCSCSLHALYMSFTCLCVRFVNSVQCSTVCVLLTSLTNPTKSSRSHHIPSHPIRTSIIATLQLRIYTPHPSCHREIGIGNRYRYRCVAALMPLYLSARRQIPSACLVVCVPTIYLPAWHCIPLSLLRPLVGWWAGMCVYQCVNHPTTQPHTRTSHYHTHLTPPTPTYRGAAATLAGAGADAAAVGAVGTTGCRLL